MARNKKNNGEPSPYKQDIAGILLVALAVFILVSNLSSSTGLVGLYFVKLTLRAILGVGIYILPLFIALYGLILLIRHEVRELTIRLSGLLILFLSFITSAQFYAPLYFAAETKYQIIQGAGGFLGYIFKFALEKTLGLMGAYIILTALYLIGILMVFNLTVLGLFVLLKSFLIPARSETETKKKIKSSPAASDQSSKSIASQMPLIKEMPVEKEVISFPIQVQEPEPESSAPPKMETPEEMGGKKQKRSYGKYKLPPLDLLDDPTVKELERQEKLKETTEFRKNLLEEALKNFGVGARVVSIHQGPAVTRYELQPDPGVKVSRIAGLADDIALNLAAQGIRIEAPVPRKIGHWH